MDGAENASNSAATGIFSSSGLLVVARLFVQIASALGTAVVARSISVSAFGSLNAGLAAFYLASTLCDWGFGLSLGKRLGQGDSRDGAVVRSTSRLQTVWSLFVMSVTLVYALASGWHEPRMRILLIMTPAVAATGIGVYRQVLIANNKTHLIVVPGVMINLTATLATVVLAVTGSGIAALAGVVCVAAVLSSFIFYYFGRQQISSEPGRSRVRRRVRREVVPLGLQSFLSSAYFTIDVVILGYFVSGTQLGHYTAAVKILNFVILIPGIIAQVSVIGFARVHADELSTMDLQTRVWQWLSFAFLPGTAWLVLYAPVVVEVFFGHHFLSVTPIVRILLAAAPLIAISNTIFGAMIARSRQRWLVYQGLFCLALNVSMNILLVPHFGIVASAWLTVITELAVTLGMTIDLSRHGIQPVYFLRAWRYYVAIAVGSLPPWFLWGSHSFIGLCASAAFTLTLFLVMKLIPDEVLALGTRRSRGGRGLARRPTTRG